MLKSLIIFFFCITSIHSIAQNYIQQSTFNKSAELIINKTDKDKIAESLDRFLYSINTETIDYLVYDTTYFSKDKTLLFIPINKNTQKSGLSNNPHFYKPIINYAEKVDNNYLIKVAFIGIDSANTPIIKQIQTFYLKNNDKNLFNVYSPFLYNIRNWKNTKIGSIRYYYEYTFDKNKANDMLKMTKTLSSIFNVPEQKINYYKFKDPKDLFDQIGADYIHNKYWSNEGGFVIDNNIYAGNNSELYIHELVHIYTRAKKHKNKTLNFWADEGLATYMGGSGSLTYDDLIKKLKALNLSNRDLIKDLYNVYALEENENFPIGYALNAYIINLVKKTDKNLLLEFIYNDGTFNNYLQLIEKHLRIKTENFNEDLLHNLTNTK